MSSQKLKYPIALDLPKCVRCTSELLDDFQLIFDDTGLELELQKLLGICFDIDIKIRLNEIQALCEDCLNELIDTYDVIQRNEQNKLTEKPSTSNNENYARIENESDSNSSSVESRSIPKTQGQDEINLDINSGGESRPGTSRNDPFSTVHCLDNEQTHQNDFEKSAEADKTQSNASETEDDEEAEYFLGIVKELDDDINNECEEDILKVDKKEDCIKAEERPEIASSQTNDVEISSKEGIKQESELNQVDYLYDLDETFDFKQYKSKVLQSKFQDICFPEGLRCRICSDTVGSHVDMIKHTAEMHCVADFAYPCIVDEKCESLTSEEDLSFHLVFKHYDLNTLVIYCKCPECDRRFNEIPSYNKHCCYQLGNVSRRRLDCDKCGQAFTSNKRYRFHLQFHLKNRRPKACLICDKQFRDEDEFFEHVMYTHEKIIGHLCIRCDRVFTSEKTYKRHEAIHKIERPYACVLCPRTYRQRHSLNDHMISSHGAESPFKCKICQEYFVSETVLNQHLMAHNKPKPTEIICCNSCGFVAENEKEAENHLEEHEDNEVHTVTEIIDKAFCCEYCELAFNTVENLVQHRILHSKKVYYCAKCSESFEDYKNFKSHKNIHADYPDKRSSFPVVRHYVCDMPGCLRSYALLLSLKAHKKQHNLKKSIKCPKCKAIFENIQEFNEHMEKIHGGFDYHCQYCTKVCSTKHALGVHIAKKHSDDQFHCESCNFSYASKELLEKHKYTMHKDLDCEICGTILKTLRNYQLHMRMVHEKEKRYFCKFCNKGFFKHCNVLSHEAAVHLNVKKFACHLCPIKFAYKASLSAHLKAHRNEYPFVCDLCNKGFRKKYSLKVHLKRHNNVRDFKCPYEGCELAYTEKTSLNFHIRLKHGDGTSLPESQRRRTNITRSIFNVPKSEVFVDDDDGLDFGSDDDEPKFKKSKGNDLDNSESDDPFTDDGLEFDSEEEADMKNKDTEDDSSDKGSVHEPDKDIFKEDLSAPAVVVKKIFSDHDYIEERENAGSYGGVI